jgi:hypothetical protein
VISTLGSVADADERNGIRSSSRRIYRAMFEVAQTMVDDRLLSSDALDRFVFPVWFPTAQEARAPIDELADLREQLEVVSVEVVPAEYHPNDVFEDQLGDPQRYAELYSGYARGFGESALRLHLFAYSANDTDEIDALTLEFFDRLTQLYRREGPKLAGETLAMTIVVRKH